MELVNSNVFSLEKARRHKSVTQNNKNFVSYLKNLDNSDLYYEINFFLNNFPADADLTPDFAYRGQMILKELASRTTDAMIKKSISTMASDLENVFQKIS